MNRTPFFIAWRYIVGSHAENSIALMVKISVAGIMVGTFALTLIVCIMSGIETVTHEKLQGIHAQVIVRAYGDQLSVQEINTVLKSEFPEVAFSSPTSLHQGILAAEDASDLTNVVMIKGIDPLREPTTNALESKITHALGNKRSFAHLLANDQILIGATVARDLGLRVGDPATLLFSRTQPEHTRTLRFTDHPAIISGIFTTGIDEFDTNLVICSLTLFEQLFPETGITQINLKLKPGTNEETTIEKLRTRLGIEVYSWKDLYPAIVSALKLEKYVMFFILALIILVASMSIISLLFMQIIQKQGDIALLKSMGMADRSLRTIFLAMGLIIASIGSLVGLVLAAAVGWFLQHCPCITLPDVYYVSTLPICLSWHHFALVFVVVMFLSLCAAWIPTKKIHAISIAHVLRFQA